MRLMVELKEVSKWLNIVNYEIDNKITGRVENPTCPRSYITDCDTSVEVSV